jgi:hypothetical protein
MSDLNAKGRQHCKSWHIRLLIRVRLLLPPFCFCRGSGKIRIGMVCHNGRKLRDGRTPHDGETLMKSRIFGVAAIAVAIYAVPALAHHSFAMFDGDKKITLDGTVKEFTWTNPHAWVVIMAMDEQGQAQQWSFECPSPSGLARKGWLPKTLKPGMKVTVVMHPLKDGQHGGSLITLTLPEGKVLESE